MAMIDDSERQATHGLEPFFLSGQIETFKNLFFEWFTSLGWTTEMVHEMIQFSPFGIDLN